MKNEITTQSTQSQKKARKDWDNSLCVLTNFSLRSLRGFLNIPE